VAVPEPPAARGAQRVPAEQRLPRQDRRSVLRDRGPRADHGRPRAPGHRPVPRLHVHSGDGDRPDLRRRARGLQPEGLLRHQRRPHLRDHAAVERSHGDAGVPGPARRRGAPPRLRLQRGAVGPAARDVRRARLPADAERSLARPELVLVLRHRGGHHDLLRDLPLPGRLHVPGARGVVSGAAPGL
ncbi:MAG: hypothetical protein AVDCRST_MAG52-1997, partial [uncultured Blastococcus sp.]